MIVEVLFIALALGSFIVSAAYVRGMDRIVSSDQRPGGEVTR